MASSQAQRRSPRLTDALFESMADAMVLCDSALVILAVNRAASELLRKPADQLVGRRADEALPRCSAVEFRPLPQTGDLGWRCDYQAGKKRRLIEVSGVVLHAPGTRDSGWALTLKNIVEIHTPPEFIGQSAVAQELLEFISRIAASRATSILLLGESGTGKELIAKRLHALSQRANFPFVPINCATLPENLLESELFGVEKGAYTDARETKPGLLEMAHGGTVLLDEIGELPLPLQAKLLRVLEDHTFRHVGGSRNLSADLRVISATNNDLEKAMQERRFRSDLYYRLNGVQVRLPALRDRPEDIPELTAHFLRHFSRVHGKSIRGIHPMAQRILERHAWPGNVRELRNVIERAVLTGNSPLVTPESLRFGNRSNGLAAKSAPAKRKVFPARYSLLGSEQELITAALAEVDGNQTRAAHLLGIGRFGLRYKMKKLGML